MRIYSTNSGVIDSSHTWLTYFEIFCGSIFIVNAIFFKGYWIYIMNDTHNIIINLGVIVIIVLIFLIFIQIRKGNKIKRDNMELSLRRPSSWICSWCYPRMKTLPIYTQRGLLGFTGLSDTEQTRFFYRCRVCLHPLERS